MPPARFIIQFGFYMPGKRYIMATPLTVAVNIYYFDVFSPKISVWKMKSSYGNMLAPSKPDLRGWSSQNEALETNFSNFIFMPFL